MFIEEGGVLRVKLLQVIIGAGVFNNCAGSLIFSTTTFYLSNK